MTHQPPPPPPPPPQHPRLLLHDFISPQLCKELEFIHRSCAAAGYRPGVLSTTFPHLAATSSAHFLLPILPLRDALRDLVEDTFACHFDLFVEFTALISWCKGASIGWHSDDNRSYLRQRDFAAVCYLNSHGKDFKGGIFHFRDGAPSSIVPAAGDVVIYTADDRNIHSVDEVTDGERLTLTLWFTRDSAHNEDAKLITLLSQSLSKSVDEARLSFLPSLASDNMYWLHRGQSGFDIRCGRAWILGYKLYPVSDENCSTSVSSDIQDLLVGPIRVGRGDDVFEMEFTNILHALQVLQFCYWKSNELESERRQTFGHEESVNQTIMKKTSELDLESLCNCKLANEILGGICDENAGGPFNWQDFSLGIARWKDYVSELHRQMLLLLPCWISNGALFYVNPSELQSSDE